jgi:hypothetical protein
MTASVRAAATIALSVAAVLGCGRTESAAPPAPAPVGANVAARSDGHIDPAPYRAEIEATEALLYSSESLGDQGWKDLSRTLLELHNAIVFNDTSAAARETSRRLFFLSAEVDAETPAARGDAELAVMRGVWEKIREDQFVSADWFHAPSP